MLTPDMSITQWWVFAFVSGVALALAAQSLAVTTAQRISSVVVPLAGAAAVVGQSAARDYEGKQPFFLFTLVALVLVILRVVYHRYLVRQIALYRAGEPADEVTKKQLAVFLLAFVAAAVLVAFLIG
ncbi:hypothetical protein [Streptomyces pactum]|uniref:Uncharacterized protein n=1 Tax=Streptomyces pactum TaxID=68249 RepID=A0A1S6J929_9ACTN|nr:hypothetical protein [Streptomyces pactum]AQS68264.1 hypothetical protein B1H29_16145 [Streptomyces pactum]